VCDRSLRQLMRQNLQNRFYAIGSLYDITTMSASADATINIAV